MEQRHARDTALDEEVVEALTKLETHVNHVSGAGAYVLDVYFGWPGLPDGTKLPESIKERFASLNLKLASTSRRRGPPSVMPLFTVGGGVEGGEGGAEDTSYPISREGSEGRTSMIADPISKLFIVEALKVVLK